MVTFADVPYIQLSPIVILSVLYMYLECSASSPERGSCLQKDPQLAKYMAKDNMTSKDTVLEVNDLHTYFFNRRGITKAVDGVSFSLKEGETLGIVGESGCGKTMTALSLLGLVPKPAARIVSGEIILDGEDLVQKSENTMEFFCAVVWAV